MHPRQLSIFQSYLVIPKTNSNETFRDCAQYYLRYCNEDSSLWELSRKAQHTSASRELTRKKFSPPSVFSPLYAAPLSFFLRIWDFITKSRTTTWLFPKNCILGPSTEHKMWPEIEHLRLERSTASSSMQWFGRSVRVLGVTLSIPLKF